MELAAKQCLLGAQCVLKRRSAVGMGSLPAGIPVEIEMILEVGTAAAPKARKPARAAKTAARKPKRRR